MGGVIDALEIGGDRTARAMDHEDMGPYRLLLSNASRG